MWKKTTLAQKKTSKINTGKANRPARRDEKIFGYLTSKCLLLYKGVLFFKGGDVKFFPMEN